MVAGSKTSSKNSAVGRKSVIKEAPKGNKSKENKDVVVVAPVSDMFDQEIDVLAPPIIKEVEDDTSCNEPMNNDTAVGAPVVPEPAQQQIVAPPSKKKNTDFTQVVPKPDRNSGSNRGRDVTKWSDGARALLKQALAECGKECRCVTRSNWPGVMAHFNSHAEEFDVQWRFAPSDMSRAASQILRIYQQEKIHNVQQAAKANNAPVPKSTIGRRVLNSKVVPKVQSTKKQRKDPYIRIESSALATAMNEYDEFLHDKLRKIHASMSEDYEERSAQAAFEDSMSAENLYGSSSQQGSSSGGATSSTSMGGASSSSSAAAAAPAIPLENEQAIHSYQQYIRTQKAMQQHQNHHVEKHDDHAEPKFVEFDAAQPAVHGWAITEEMAKIHGWM